MFNFYFDFRNLFYFAMLLSTLGQPANFEKANKNPILLLIERNEGQYNDLIRKIRQAPVPLPSPIPGGLPGGGFSPIFNFLGQTLGSAVLQGFQGFFGRPGNTGGQPGAPFPPSADPISPIPSSPSMPPSFSPTPFQPFRPLSPYSQNRPFNPFTSFFRPFYPSAYRPNGYTPTIPTTIPGTTSNPAINSLSPENPSISNIFIPSNASPPAVRYEPYTFNNFPTSSYYNSPQSIYGRYMLLSPSTRYRP